MVLVRSVEHVTSTGAGSAALKCRQQLLDAVDDLDDIGAGLALDVEQDGRRCVHPARRAWCSPAPSIDVRNIAKLHRRAVAVGDDEVVVVRRLSELVVGVDGVGAGRAVETCLSAC